MRSLWWALQRFEIIMVVLYFLIDGIITPSFADFSYFFLMNVIGVSKFMFAMITLIGQVCSILGVILYEKFLKEMEVRTVLFWNVGLTILGAFLNYCFAMRWNVEIGISDYAFIIFTDVVFGAITTAFSTLPIMALFAKITPRRVEGTVFAFLTGTSNLDQGVIAPLMGAWINNQFVGVNKDDQSGYSTLALISLILAPLGFAIVFLIPKKEDITRREGIR
jgi:Na+/melibiose symporter-like transporter